jgi:hypothetical protein
MDESIGQVGEGVEEDGPKKDGKAAAFVAQHPPKDATQEHAGHLTVDQENAFGEDAVARYPQGLQALDADDREEDEVVDVDEVAEGGDQDGESDGTGGILEG